MNEATSPGISRPAAVVDDRTKVHPLVREAAEWSWRLLLIAAALWVFGQAFIMYREIFVPLLLAVMLTAILNPLVNLLDRWHVPRSVAVIVSVLAALAAIGAGLAWVAERLIGGIPMLTDELTGTIDQARNWLADGPLHVSSAQVHAVSDHLIKILQDNEGKLTSGALSTVMTTAELLTGLVLLIFLTVFFLYGGRRIFGFVTLLIPAGPRERVRVASDAGFKTLVGYVRATVLVSLIDSTCIGIGLWLLGVPLALPLAALVFVGGFIPIVGAVLTGAVAVVVALVTKGFVTALIVLALLVFVMLLEGHVLQPFLTGRSVSLHPVAVVVVIAIGIVSVGIIGGLLAVPIASFLNTAIRSLNAQKATDAGLRRPAMADGPSSSFDPRLYLAAPDDPLWQQLRRRPD